MTYDEWEKQVPAAITNDTLWRVQAYRLALFLADLAWYDVCKLVKVPQTVSLSDQLYRSAGSISANIGEGYSRASGKDQARFYEYALGSAREARGWYFKGRHVLGAKVSEHRINFLARIIQLLLRMIPDARGKYIREESALYSPQPLEEFLQNIPFSEDEQLTHDASRMTKTAAT